MLNKRNRSFNRSLLLLIGQKKFSMVAMVLVLALTGCSLLPIEEERLVPPLIQPAEEPLSLLEVKKGSIETYLKGTANFVSSTTEALFFKKTGGKLKGIYVVPGQKVEKGELLVELETGDLALQLQLQKLSMERAELFYIQAKIEEESSVNLRLREIDLEREKLLLQSAQENLDSARLYSPISGIITFVESVQVGDFINSNQSIVTVADPNQMKLTYIAADGKDVAAIEAGMPAAVKYKGKDYVGTVVQTPSNIPIKADPAKAERNAITLIIHVDDLPEDTQIGHSAELSIQLQKREGVVVLPRSALRSYMGRSYVQIAEKDLRREVDIEVGLMTATQIEVINGLEEGQKVILNN